MTTKIQKQILSIILLTALSIPLFSDSGWSSTAEDQLAEAAMQGSVSAMLSLARIYSDKNSALFSDSKARSWYQKAAEQGDAGAQRALGAMFELGYGSQPDYQKAAYWYQKAAIQGLARAQTNLGNLYETGRGVPLDYNESFRWYSEAAIQGYARAQVYLGQLYMQGQGVEQAPAKAHEWFHKAAQQGYSRAYMQLGKAYQNGIGVEQDPRQAQDWYKRAADQGFPPAKKALNNLTKQLLTAQQQRSEDVVDAITVDTDGADTNVKPEESTQLEPILVAKETVYTINAMADSELRLLDKEIATGQYDDGSFIAAIMQEECSDFNPDYLDREILAAEAELEENDLGLKFESGYRFNEGDTTAERQRAYAGLSWDLLSEGLFENKSRGRRNELEKQVNDIKAAKLRLKNLFSCRDTLLIHSFNRFKKNILKQREKVLDEFYQLSRQAYFSGQLLADDLLKTELQVARTKARINTYNRLEGQIVAERQRLDQLPPPQIIGINLDAVIEAIRQDPSYQEIAKLSETILKESHDSLYEKRLRLYAQTGIDEKNGELSDGDISAGIYFSMPLLRRTTVPLPVKMNKMKSDLQQEREIRLLEASRLYNGYNEKLTDATTMVYRMQTVAERLRRSRIKSDQRFQETGTYGFNEHLLVLTHLQELLDTRMEYIAVEESLYRQLLHLFTKLSLAYHEDFTSPIEVDLPITRGRMGNRAVYIWSKSFSENDNRYLFDLFRTKAIRTAILSASNTIDPDKLRRFVQQATIENVNVELMVSDNSWVFPQKWPDVNKRIEELVGFGLPIHLDIEPHTLAAYKANKNTYDRYFIDLIAKIKSICAAQKVQLSISLPLTADTILIEEANKLCDQLYIMAYGSMTEDRLAERLLPFSSIPRKKLTIAQRPSDFDSEMQLEQRIDTLSTNSSFSSFAFHDLEQLMNIARMEKL